MIVIVFYHSILFWSGTWFVDVPIINSPLWADLSAWFNSFHIYAFALVSGYLFSYLKLEKGKYDKFVPFAIGKAKRLLVPYFFIAIFWVIPISVYFFNYGFTDIVNRFILATSPSQLWFLWMLFDVFVIFCLLSKFFERRNLLGLILVIAFYGVGLIGARIIPNYFMILRACTYMPFFWIGFKLRQCGSGIVMKIPSFAWIIADIALFILARWLLNGENLFIRILNLGVTFLLNIVGAVMAFVVLQKIAFFFKNWRENKILVALSRCSMPIYLIHQQVVYFFIPPLNGYVNPYLHAIIIFVCALSISLAVSLLLMKFKFSRFLLGEK